jgi:linoleoyl-CoA desaturase
LSQATSAEATAVKYPPHSPLRAALLDRVQAYFERTGRRRDGGFRMYIKSALIVAWLVLSYALLVFWASTWWQALPLAVSLGLAVAGVGFNIQHDGGHGSYARRRFGNRFSAWTLDLVGGSSYFWNFKHNIIHHQYTNIDGVDDDIDGAPFLRLAPGQPRRWYHRFQYLYSWVLYAFFPPKWALYDDFRSLVRGRIGAQRIPRPRGLDLAILLGGKLFYVGWTLALPLALHPVLPVLLIYAFYSLTLGVTLATVFQLAHCVEEATIEQKPATERRIERSFFEHQLATTVDFAPRSRWLTWYLGGLNFQVEHHLFPRISHVHYPALAPITREVCREHGVPLLTHETFFGALRSHLRFLRQMGRPARRPLRTSPHLG